MGYYIIYYVKKYWYVFTLLFLVIFLYIIVSMNSDEIVSYFERFDNKISLEPDHYTETQIDDVEFYLSELKVGVPYIGTSLHTYIPSNLSEDEKIDFLRELENDPNYAYKKTISWANNSLTVDEYEELIELVGYHLNRNASSTSTFVSIPSNEELEEYGQEVLYYTDGTGTLFLNVSVEEVNSSSSISKTYCYTFRLKYDMKGKVTIS